MRALPALATLGAKTWKAGAEIVSASIARLMPACRAHITRLEKTRTSCLNLHPSHVAPPELCRRERVRDLLIELGFAPDPGEWIFCSDHQKQWTWEYVVRDAVTQRSSNTFSDLKACLKDANDHGFSSVFALYSSRSVIPPPQLPDAASTVLA